MYVPSVDMPIKYMQ